MKILALCLPGMGDTLMFTPTLAALKRARPDAEVTALTMLRGTESILTGNPHVDRVEYIDLLGGSRPRSIASLLRLRRSRFDVSLTAFPSYRRAYHLTAFLTGAKRRIAHRFARGFLSQTHFLNTDLVPASDDQHNVENNLRLLEPLGIRASARGTKLELPLSEADRAWATAYSTQHGIDPRRTVGMHPGSIHFPYSPPRRWPTDRFAALTRRLGSQGLRSLIFEGPSERGVGAAIRNAGGPDTHVVTEEDLHHVTALIASLAAFVSNDSGLLHLAAAAGTPAVGIFITSNPTWTHPWAVPYRIAAGPHAASIRRPYPLRPKPPEPDDIPAIDSVASALGELLRTTV